MSQILIESIANEVGVSPRTVLRVLAGKVKDKRPTIQSRFERIRRLAAERSYRPNAAARATRSGRFNNVALVLGSDGFRSHLPDQLLAGIHDGLDVTGEHLIVARLSDAQLSDAEYMPKFMVEWMCDGMLINYNLAVPPRLVELVSECRVPAMWINVRFPNNCVLPDDIACGRMATERLLSLGHRRITYCDFTWNAGRLVGLEHHSRLDRFSGYAAAMRTAGLTPSQFCDAPGGESVPELAMRVDSWLRSPERPTGIVCNGAEWRLIERQALRLGLRLPEDLSVLVAGQDVRRDEVGGTVLPLREIGRAAALGLIANIRDGIESAPAVVVPPTLHEGLSVARAPDVG